LKEKQMNANTLKAVTRHGETLLRAFPNATEKNPVALCKKLRRIETSVAPIILRNCNEGVPEDEMDAATDKALARVGKLLGLDKCGIAFCKLFVSRDPRGYALKLDNDDGTGWFSDWQKQQYAAKLPALHTDMGGYGIIAPDLNQSKIGQIMKNTKSKSVRIACTPAVASVAPLRGELGAEDPLRRPWRMFGTDIYGFGVMNAEGEIQIGANTLNLLQACAVVEGVNQRPHLMDALDDLHALSHGSIREHLTVEDLAATMRARITTACLAIAKAKGGAS
jgi:hypothetical protein